MTGVGYHQGIPAKHLQILWCFEIGPMTGAGHWADHWAGHHRKNARKRDFSTLIKPIPTLFRIHLQETINKGSLCRCERENIRLALVHPFSIFFS